MRIARFRTVAGQQFIEGTMASAGAFIGGETAEAEAAVLASESESLAGLIGEAVEAVIGATDPWDGVSALLALPEPLLSPPPDWSGLRLAVKAMPELGTTDSERLINVNAAFAKWPTANISLEAGDALTLRGTVEAMLATGTIRQVLYDALQQLMLDHNIPGGS